MASIPDCFTLRQSPPYLLNEARWATEQIRIVWKRDNFLAPSGIRNPDHERCTAFSILTTLSWLVLTRYEEFINVSLQ
jgi:hypothetical protein